MAHEQPRLNNYIDEYYDDNGGHCDGDYDEAFDLSGNLITDPPLPYSQQTTYQYMMDSFFLLGNSRFGTIYLFCIEKVYYVRDTDKVDWAELKFKIRCDWMYKLWKKHLERKHAKCSIQK